MKKIFIATLMVVCYVNSFALAAPYWWSVVDVGTTKIEIDVNNIREMTAVTRIAPIRFTVGNTVVMRMLTVNCAAGEALIGGNTWKPAVPYQMSICNH